MIGCSLCPHALFSQARSHIVIKEKRPFVCLIVRMFFKNMYNNVIMQLNNFVINSVV